MAGGTPVVAIGLLGPRDVVTDGVDGYLTKNTQEDFIKHIVKLLKNEKLRKTMSENAPKNVEKFSIENCADRLVEIYEEAILIQPKDKKIPFWRKLISKLWL
jgi:1,2-diacylglycerol 3-alpha-glucosyltransferase